MDSFSAVHLSSFLLTLLFLALSRAPGGAAPFAGGILALSFLHFASTLVLFYREPGAWRRSRLLGGVFPALLLVACVGGAYAAPAGFARALAFFFPLLFWHYTKQSLGIFVLSVRSLPGMADPDSLPRQLVLGAFLLLGVQGYFSSQIGAAMAQSFGFYVPTLGLEAGPWLAYLRGGALLALAVPAYYCWRSGNWLAWLTPLSFALWMDFSLFHFALLPFLPALHALQYLPLVFARGRRVSARPLLLLAIALVIAGASLLLFRHTPRRLLLIGLALSSLEIVLNVHHYFIDAYIWRARDEGRRADLGL